jgi:threonine synthase
LIDEPRVRMSGAQAEGCSPVATAHAAGSLNFRPVKPNTIAKSLAIGNPADGYYALVIMQETGGHCPAVSDDEVVAGIKLLAETEGIFAETAGGVVTACLKRLAEAGSIDPDETTVAFITGGGLKTQEAVSDHVIAPLHIAATVDSFEEKLLARREAAVA